MPQECPSPDVVAGVWVGGPQHPLPHEEGLHPHPVGVRPEVLQFLEAVDFGGVVVRRVGGGMGLGEQVLAVFGPARKAK